MKTILRFPKTLGAPVRSLGLCIPIGALAQTVLKFSHTDTAVGSRQKAAEVRKALPAAK